MKRSLIFALSVSIGSMLAGCLGAPDGEPESGAEHVEEATSELGVAVSEDFVLRLADAYEQGLLPVSAPQAPDLGPHSISSPPPADDPGSQSDPDPTPWHRVQANADPDPTPWAPKKGEHTYAGEP